MPIALLTLAFAMTTSPPPATPTIAAIKPEIEQQIVARWPDLATAEFEWRYELAHRPAGGFTTCVRMNIRAANGKMTGDTFRVNVIDGKPTFSTTGDDGKSALGGCAMDFVNGVLKLRKK